jgi:hypothetical protein
MVLTANYSTKEVLQAGGAAARTHYTVTAAVHGQVFDDLVSLHVYWVLVAAFCSQETFS